MAAAIRNSVRVYGTGTAAMVFAHGFGCDQTMWRYLIPNFEERFRIVTFDLVGSGASDPAAYDRDKYASLEGYADDLVEIIEECTVGPVVFVGHSVSAMIGLLATVKAPERFAAQVMLGASPCYLDDGDYVGGFSRADVDELLATMDANYVGWASSMAPAIMGAPDRPELGSELAGTLCRNDPAIARHFARVILLSDHRADLAKSRVPALVVQCSDDLVVPRSVADYLHRRLPGSALSIVDNVGHCPHLTAPVDTSSAIDAFLARTLA